MKLSKKLKKRILNPYNLGVIACIILIVIAVYIFVKPEKKVTPSGIEVVASKVSESEEISEEDARKLAVKQLKKIGEDVNTEDLEVMKILKNKEEHYYISSPQNTVEIKIKGGIITMINSATVDE